MKISAAMIVKNESRCIIRCLNNLIDIVDEIAVVDTGSTDNTIELIKEFSRKQPKVHLYDFEWIDDFAAARNFSLSKVTGDWIIAMDADEYFHDEDKFKIREYCAKASTLHIPLLLQIKCMNLVDGKVTNVLEKGIARIFNNGYGFCYSDKIHETLVLPNGNTVNKTNIDVRMYHDGYDPAAVNVPGKKKRNINLISKELDIDITNAKYLMYFANEVRHYDFEKALKYYDLALKYSDSEDLTNWILYFKNQVEVGERA